MMICINLHLISLIKRIGKKTIHIHTPFMTPPYHHAVKVLVAHNFPLFLPSLPAYSNKGKKKKNRNPTSSTSEKKRGKEEKEKPGENFN